MNVNWEATADEAVRDLMQQDEFLELIAEKGGQHEIPLRL